GEPAIYASSPEELNALGLGDLLIPTFHCGTSPSCDIDLANLYAKDNPRRSAYTNMLPDGKTSIFGISNTTTIDFSDQIRLKNIFAYRTAKDDHNTDIDGTAMAIVDVV